MRLQRSQTIKQVRGRAAAEAPSTRCVIQKRTESPGYGLQFKKKGMQPASQLVHCAYGDCPLLGQQYWREMTQDRKRSVSNG